MIEHGQQQQQQQHDEKTESRSFGTQSRLLATPPKPASTAAKIHPSKNIEVMMMILPFGDQILRFLVLLVLSWIFSYAAMKSNAKWTVETFIPWSFWLLHFLVMFGIIGQGWPFTAPAGIWGQKLWEGHGRLLLGYVMLLLLVGMGAALSAFFTNVYPKYPLFPGGAWFGICLFYVTLWWVLNIQVSPKPIIPLQRFSPPVNIAINSVICIALALGVFQLINFEGPANADDSNPKGPFDASYLFGLLVSIIVWVQCFSSILVFQGFPTVQWLHNLPHPVPHILLTILSVGLGFVAYEAVMALGVDGGFYADAIGASQISGSLYHAVAFDFWPYHTLPQPKRGIYSFVLSQVIFPFFWIWICRTILEPIYNVMVDANPLYGELFSIHTMIPWYSLHVVAPLLLIHQSFFMRWPFPPPGPPLGPMDVGVEECAVETMIISAGDDAPNTDQQVEEGLLLNATTPFDSSEDSA